MQPIVLLLTALTTCALLCCAKDRGPGKDKASVTEEMAWTEALDSKKGGDFEPAFLGLMINPHEGGASMWAIAKAQSKNEEIKSMEQTTTPKEKKEICEMTQWLKDWHQKTPGAY